MAKITSQWHNLFPPLGWDSERKEDRFKLDHIPDICPCHPIFFLGTYWLCKEISPGLGFLTSPALCSMCVWFRGTLLGKTLSQTHFESQHLIPHTVNVTLSISPPVMTVPCGLMLYSALLMFCGEHTWQQSCQTSLPVGHCVWAMVVLHPCTFGNATAILHVGIHIKCT